MRAAEITSAPIIILDEVDSTNAQAERRIRAGHYESVWLMARAQTAGRGRQGRVWQSPPGNLYASLVLPVARSGPRPLSDLSFVAGLAVRDMAVAMGGVSSDIKLKWPNDVLLSGAKCAGILIERLSENDRDFAVIGVGINLVSAPEGLDYPVAALVSSVSPSEALKLLAKAFAARLVQWQGRQGFDAVRQDWLAVAAGRNGPIEIRRESGALRGTFTDLDSDGALLVRLPSGAVATVHAGDIIFPSNKALVPSS